MIKEELAEWMERAEAVSDVATESVEVDIRQLRAILRVDGEFFIEFFLAEQLDMPVPEFHVEIWSLLTDLEKERVLLAIPRDHAKTTLAKLVVIWYWLFTTHRFCVYISNTNPIAKAACKDILEFLSTPNFVSTFGEIEVLKSADNESLWIFELPMGGGKTKRCILRAVGQGQQMRGINIDNQRPDIAVIDDVEDNDTADSEFQQKKLDKWIFGPFLKALARKKKILWLGNMLAKTTLLARLSRAEKWNPVVFGCLVKDTATGLLQPLWSGKWTVDALKDDFKEYRENGLVETWMCEMMNMPGHGENGFTADQINYQPAPTPDDIIASWLTIDPAFGVNADSDETAIAVHVLPREGVPMTVTVVHGHMAEATIFDEALALTEYWGCRTWGIEAVAAQKVLLTLFHVFFAQRQMMGQIELVPLMAGKGDPKVARIRSWVGLMAKKEWAISDNAVDIVTQLINFNVRKKNNEDDIIDSCAYGPQMQELYLPLIMAQAAGENFAIHARGQYGSELTSG